MQSLRRWWTKKYSLPITSDEWGKCYWEDMYVEMIEDLMEEDEDLSRELRLKHTGMEFGPSGDPLIDMWEKQISQGETPDLNTGDDEKSMKRDQLIRQAARRHYEQTGERIFRARLPELYELTELQESKQGEEFNANEYMSGHGGVEDDHLDLQKLSPAAVDKFLNATGRIKRT